MVEYFIGLFLEQLVDFLLLVAAASARVFGPLLIESRYILWIALSQVLWMAAFLLLAAVYLPVFWSARVDGKPG